LKTNLSQIFVNFVVAKVFISFVANFRQISMKYILLGLVMLGFTAQFGLWAQTQDSSSIEKKTFPVQISPENSHLQEIGELQFRLIEAQTKANEQQTYKFIFLASMLFVLLLGVFTLILFYGKTKKTTELLVLQNKEIELRETRIRQLSILLDNVESPLLIARSNGEIQWLNRSFEHFYQITIKDLQEKSKSNFITDIAVPVEQEHIRKALDEANAVSYPVQSGLGTQFYRTVFALPGADGKPIGLGIIDNLSKPHTSA